MIGEIFCHHFTFQRVTNDSLSASAIVDMTDPKNKGVPVQGWMSHKSKIYLVCLLPLSHTCIWLTVSQADVHDHMDYILTSLDMFTGIADNLVDYTFNMASYEMNEVMCVCFLHRVTLNLTVVLQASAHPCYNRLLTNDLDHWLLWYELRAHGKCEG